MKSLVSLANEFRLNLTPQTSFQKELELGY